VEQRVGIGVDSWCQMEEIDKAPLLLPLMDLD
jgi:hypothetical protein